MNIKMLILGFAISAVVFLVFLYPRYVERICSERVGAEFEHTKPSITEWNELYTDCFSVHGLKPNRLMK